MSRVTGGTFVAGRYLADHINLTPAMLLGGAVILLGIYLCNKPLALAQA